MKLFTVLAVVVCMLLGLIASTEAAIFRVHTRSVERVKATNQVCSGQCNGVVESVSLRKETRETRVRELFSKRVKTLEKSVETSQPSCAVPSQPSCAVPSQPSCAVPSN